MIFARQIRIPFLKRSPAYGPRAPRPSARRHCDGPCRDETRRTAAELSRYLDRRPARDAIGPEGTLLAYADWDGAYDNLLDDEGRVPETWRTHLPPFDPASSRAIRDNGVLPEFLRTPPGSKRSGNPGASIAAFGAGADWITQDHPLDYGYGEGSPLAKLVAIGGKVLMVGAPLDTPTLLHHAEHLAQIPGKRLRREVPLAAASGTLGRIIQEFDTGEPAVAGLDDDYFAEIVSEFLPTGVPSKPGMTI